jgi:ribosomal protein S28E/S33
MKTQKIVCIVCGVVGMGMISLSYVFCDDMWRSIPTEKFEGTQKTLKLSPPAQTEAEVISTETVFPAARGKVAVYNKTHEVVMVSLIGRVPPGGRLTHEFFRQASDIAFEGVETGRVYGRVSVGPTQEGIVLIVRENGVERRDVFE